MPTAESPATRTRNIAAKRKRNAHVAGAKKAAAWKSHVLPMQNNEEKRQDNMFTKVPDPSFWSYEK